jgi:diguanylate cyclase (GGDEF)-like protein/PAS domain S-box-containing protein
MKVIPHKIGSKRLPLLAAAFVVLVCAVILGVSGAREWSSRTDTLKAAEVDMANLARSLTQHAEDSVDLASSILIGLVGALETDGASPEKIARTQSILNRRKATLGRIRGLFVYDENGRWLATTEAVNLTDYNNSDREYFKYHRDSADRNTRIGRPLLSRSSGQWTMTLSRRWNHADGAFGGVVSATVDVKYFSDFYQQFDIGAHGAVALLNADGIIMARSPDDGTYVGRDTSNGPLFRQALLQSPRGVYYFKSPLDGMQRVSFYQRSDRYPLVLLATMQQDEVLAPWRSAAISRMSVVLGLVTLIAVIGFYLVRQLLLGRRMVTALAAEEANFRVLAEGSSDMVTRIGLDERIFYVSPSCDRIVGWRPDQLVGTPALAGVNPEDMPRVEEVVASLKRGEAEEARISYRTRHREKSEIWVESTLRVTRHVDGEIDGVVAISRDVTEQKDLEEKLENLAIEDGLTGLANRRRFDERLQAEWARSVRDGNPLSLLMIDVDHFKKFNDQYGHPAGDACLQSVAGVLAEEARRPADLAARYGGEEFAVLLPNTDAAGCALIGERIRCALREAGIPHALNLPSGVVTASFGGAICRPGTERSGPASLTEAADRALYAAKRGGRDRLVMSGQVILYPPVAATG